MIDNVFPLHPHTPEPKDTPSITTPQVVNDQHRFPGLSDEFWGARPVLTHIYKAARARVEVPDVVFHSLMARQSALTPHTMVMDTGLGGDGCLNLFGMLVGYAGQGKTRGFRLASSLMPAPEGLDFAGEMPLGSGEGLAEQFMGMVPEWIEGKDGKRGKWMDIKRQVRHNSLIYVDEGEYLVKTLTERNGTTTGAAIRSAWCGDTIGQLNATQERTRVVPHGTYSMGMIISIQPKLAARIVADSHTGMPQRFLFSTCSDLDIGDERVPWPGSLPWDPEVINAVGRDREDQHGNPIPPVRVVIEFPDEVKDELFANEVARKKQTMILAELDGQSPLMLCKLAANLALLDSRRYVNVEDWRLAKMVWANSCEIRDMLLTTAAVEAELDSDERDQRAVDRAVLLEVAKADIPHHVERVARLALRHSVESEGGITRKELRGKLNKRDRPLLNQAVDHAVAQGLIKLGAGGYKPVSPE